MGTIKDINKRDLTEEDIKKGWQEYTEELYKKDLHDPDNHVFFFFCSDGLITHLEPDILKWKPNGTEEATLQTKLVEVMEFQLNCLKP